MVYVRQSSAVLTVMTRTDPDMSKKHKGLSLILFEKQPGDDFMPPALTGSPSPPSATMACAVSHSSSTTRSRPRRT